MAHRTYKYGNKFLLTVGEPAVIGTCVESRDDAGEVLASGLVDSGNYAICHWMYYKSVMSTSSTNQWGLQNRDWGETRYLEEADWSTDGSTLKGTMIQRLGKKVETTTNGFKLHETNVATYIDRGIYTMSWYQPPY